jgi:DeoR family transcriptional regulator, suf operon transcriptional repressor
MQTTKQQILTLLKRTGSATVEEAAGALTVASMTARQHLLNLERDGLVTSERVRRSNGRPHYLYRLTPKGEEMFPRRYDLLARILLDEMGALVPEELVGLGPDEKRSLLIQRAADRLAERFRFDADGRNLEERVAGVTDVLHLVGGFAEWVHSDDGFEIRDYNCVFASLVDPSGDCCEGHVRLISQLLRWPVRHESVQEGDVRCCRYVVSPHAVPQSSDNQPASDQPAEEGQLANA